MRSPRTTALSERRSICAGNEYWITWQRSYGGGLANEDDTGPMRGAGEIAEYMLRFVGERVDHGRMSAIRGYLDRFKLDVAILEPVRPRAWITKHVLPWLPLVWRESEDGIYLDVYRYDATEADAVLDLVEIASAEDRTEQGSVPVTRFGLIRSGDARAVENDITICYAPMRGTDPLKRRRVAAQGIRGSAGVASTAVSGEIPMGLLKISQSHYGLRPVSLDCLAVCDDDTADLLLTTRARWKGVVRRTLTIADDNLILDVLEPGAVVTYSESAVSISGAVALVRSLTLGLDSDEAELELLDAPEAP